MKYNTFRNILWVVGAIVGVVVLNYSCRGSASKSDDNKVKAFSNSKSGNAPTAQDIMKVFDSSTGGKPKLKDAFSSSPTKVNLYDDMSKGKWGRAKIDYDRDEKDDEKWERDPVTGQITREISSNDDGNFDIKETWNGTAFVNGGGAPVVNTPPVEAPPVETPPVAPGADAGKSGALAVKDIMGVFESSTNGQIKLKDAFSGSPTKVNMYDDAKTGKWTRAKIDYDRDEKDDEKWERDSATGQITRILSPNEDDVFGPKQTWNGSSFVQ